MCRVNDSCNEPDSIPLCQRAKHKYQGISCPYPVLHCAGGPTAPESSNMNMGVRARPLPFALRGAAMCKSVRKECMQRVCPSAHVSCHLSVVGCKALCAQSQRGLHARAAAVRARLQNRFCIVCQVPGPGGADGLRVRLRSRRATCRDTLQDSTLHRADPRAKPWPCGMPS